MAERIKMLDVMRGLAMFFIVGGDVIFRTLAQFCPGVIRDVIWEQLGHYQWEGFSFYDGLFPTFLLISGTAFTFSWEAQRRKGIFLPVCWRRLAVRTLILILLGIFYNGALACSALDEIRVPSVLARIGLGVFLAAVPYALLPEKWRALFFPVGLLAYAMLFSLCGGYAEMNNWAGKIDAALIPNANSLDPEGCVSTLGAALTAYLGMLLGDFLRRPLKAKELWMALAGGVLILVAVVAESWCPVIKKLWTSTYVCMAGGWTLLVCAGVMCLTDRLALSRFFTPLTFIGVSALWFYLLPKVLDFYAFTWRLIALPTHLVTSSREMQELILAIVAFGLLYFTVSLLRKRRIG